jgi:hypothetical protein
MKMKEFREMLVGLPDDMLIVLSSDAEGNYLSPFAESSVEWYFPEGDHGGDIYDEEDAPNGAEPALVLWPVN